MARTRPNMQDYKTVLAGKCPFGGDRIGGTLGTPPTLADWYPDRLRIELLARNAPSANPLGTDFDYPAAFAKIDLAALKNEIKGFLTSSVDWWPSDYGNYGPQMIRMAWHSAGSYRIADGRGGAGEAMQRFAPIESWWDNGNIDKSRRLLWPIKAKYGASLSWADLIVLTGTCALEIMGFPTYGFAGGREDAWIADDATYWGPEVWDPEHIESFDSMTMRDKRWRGQNGDADYDLEQPLAASNQALIYVNPEGPYGKGDPEASARDIRVTFTRMAMNDEETVALIAGGHAFGKSHGMVPPDRIGAPPEMAPVEAMGLGWHNPEGSGNAENTMTNGIEGSWTQHPTRWDNDYLHNLFGNEWEQTRSPAGSLQWTPVDKNAPQTPDAHIPGKTHPLMMMTSDIALKVDPVYRTICERFLNDFDYFTEQFSKAWYKLTHRDMGPRERYIGPEATIAPDLLWQDPIPERDHALIDAGDVAALKQTIAGTGLSVSDLAYTALSAALPYRDSDKRGGANGARLALAPQKDWDINARTRPVIEALQGVKAAFDGSAGDKRVSLADLIVLGGVVAIERAAADAGHAVEVPFTAGRRDTTDALTDADSFEWLRPVVDGFRNYTDPHFAEVTAGRVAPEQLFLDKAALLRLSVPEWAALTGGLRVLGANWDGSEAGVFTTRKETLTNDFFVHVTSMDHVWAKADEAGQRFAINDRATGEKRYDATRYDLIFGANNQLRAVSEVYAAVDGQERFVRDFVAAWDKLMTADLFGEARAHRIG
ncbi:MULTISPECIES: catalase/peroxidase HPI [unclassified Sphingomonas]|uniref:catalase/peroxidase HPI n=1 Tax=unclassified Sphingomonas TaxID=196159 RepID=UPI0006FB120A|nr:MULTISPECIES: catalase/peroxidase HPI [unclassified Sphingomonas]KQM23650.1 hydroperoxidase [Sphingomonas sp. Leaf9]KQM41894.1 hydroperoxidase [Sphingomonas sp. Leaf11]